ncbi:TPA: colicin immunity protein [Escherichia coli]|nr:colicin immunity protein [Escherichia coli]
MNKKFYFSRLSWGLLPVFFAIYNLIHGPLTSKTIQISTLYILSGILLPVSMYTVKNIALKYTSIQFWNPTWLNSNGVNRFYVIYVFFCIVFAIPFSILYLYHRYKSSKK